MVSSKGVLACIFLLIAFTANAQINRYMVFFKDKVGSVYSVNEPQAFLSQRAIDRRIKQSIAVTQNDLPVNKSYVQGVRDVGARTFFTSRWMNGVLVQCEQNLVSNIEALPYVSRVEFVAPNERLGITGRKRTEMKVKELKTASSTQAQLQMIGLDDMQREGHRGEGMIIAVFDGGFPGVNTAPPFQHIFNDNRIDLEASKDFVMDSGDVFQYDDHGTQVFSVIAAHQEGFYVGGSYRAVYQLYVTEDVGSEYRIEEYNWLFAAERADSAGVDVVNSSLGYYNFHNPTMDYPKSAIDGKTAVVTRAAQMLADRGVIVVCSAGNEGSIAWQIVTPPADARDVLAVGNVNGAGIRAGSSSTGPTADGRTKPDVVALGINTSVIRPSGSQSTSSGTSLASPLITSLAAGVWQRYPYLTNLQVMDAIRKSASQGTLPDNFLGHGIPNFKSIVNYLEETKQENVFEVYPNPTADSIVIRPFDPTQVNSCKVEVVSTLGKVMFETFANFSWSARTHTSYVTTLPVGVYFMRITWGEKKYTFRIVKV